MIRAALAVSLVLSAVPADAQDTITSYGISAFGDLKYPEDFKHFDYVNPEAPKGGTMSFRGTGASQTFDSLNPFILQGEPAQGIGHIYDTLLTGSSDEPDSMYGLLASGLEYPKDRSWVIFTLRPEATFSDGQPVTADDVVFTFKALKEKGQAQYQIQIEGVDKVEALAPDRVKFTFKSGIATRDMPSTVGTIEILPRHYYDDTHPFERPSLDPPVGSGPYVVTDVRPGRSIRYCRNKDYWGADLPVNVGINNFDCYQYEYFADTTAAFEAFKVGQVLFQEEYSSLIWATGYDFPAVAKGWVIKAEPHDDRPSGTQGFWINLRRPILQDPKVREAIATMFNFEWTNATLFYGLYLRTDSFWENSTMQAEGLPQGEELAALEEFRDKLPPEIFTEPAYEPPVWGDQPTDRKALRRAAALLDEAGWTVGPDGFRVNDKGERLTLDFADDSPSFQRIVDPYIENLRRAGIDARFELVDPAQFQERQKTFDYDITAGRLVMSLSPSVELRTLLGSASANAQGTLNFSGLADPVVDALIDRIIAAPSRDVMEARTRALDRVLRYEQIWVPNWYRDAFWIAYWDVFGKPDTKPLYSRGDETWWIDQDKLKALQAQGALR